MKTSSSSFFRFSIRPWGLLAAGGSLVCLATLFGFLGRFAWFFDLFSHFPIQYLIALSLLGVVFFAGRRYKTATIYLGFACANLAIVLPLYFGGPIAPPEGATSFRVMLLNVNTRDGDPKKVNQFIDSADPDMIVLQEVNFQWMTVLASLETSHPHALVMPREDNFGITLISKFPLIESEIVFIGNAEVPSIVATVDTGSSHLRVIATHPLPPGGREYSHLRNEQLEKLPEYVRSSLPVILLGDLNVTPWNYHFQRLLKRTGLKNSAQGRGIQPTWPSHYPLLRIPIDHCLHSSDILILDRKVGPDVSSDHFPVIVDFAIMEK